jgi:hypothetical protein
VDENVFDYPREVRGCGQSQNVEPGAAEIIHSCPEPLNIHKHSLRGPLLPSLSKSRFMHKNAQKGSKMHPFLAPFGTNSAPITVDLLPLP